MNQFDFASNWRKSIKPLLNKPAVVRALNLGMLLQGDDYKPGDPPWEHGRGPLNGQRAKEGCLSWYQPLGGCHYIAPFSWAIGKELFPNLKWGFITSDVHTVAIGYDDNWEKPALVLDILLFQHKSAEESLNFTKVPGWRFYRTLPHYAASFCTNPEYGLEIYQGIIGNAEPAATDSTIVHYTQHSLLTAAMDLAEMVLAMKICAARAYSNEECQVTATVTRKSNGNIRHCGGERCEYCEPYTITSEAIVETVGGCAYENR